MSSTIIGLTGPAGSGKSTFADYMLQVTHGERLSFASPLKRMVACLLDDLGYDGEALVSTQEGKATLIHELSSERPVDVRHLLQTIGTEWGRQCVCSSMWVDVAMARAYSVNGLAVLDDVRFDNEAQAIRNGGGMVVHIKRKGFGGVNEHASEKPVEVDYTTDQVVYNDDGLSILAWKAAAIAEIALSKGGA